MPERVIGQHKGCGGDVAYWTTRGQGGRRCTKCGADGRYGRPSPDLEYELRCADCGAAGERTGHMTCQYPQDHP